MGDFYTVLLFTLSTGLTKRKKKRSKKRKRNYDYCYPYPGGFPYRPKWRILLPSVTFKIRLEVILWLSAIAIPFFIRWINSNEVESYDTVYEIVSSSMTFIILALLLRFQPPALGSDTEITLIVIIGTFLAVPQTVFVSNIIKGAHDVFSIVPGGSVVLIVFPAILGTFFAEGILKVKNLSLPPPEHSKSLEITLWVLSLMMPILFSMLDDPIYSSIPFIILTVLYKLNKINSIKTVFWLTAIFLIMPVFSFIPIIAPNSIFIVPFIIALLFCMVGGIIDFIIDRIISP